MDRIKELILAEADYRMENHTYQDRAAAIHEVLMEVGMACGEEMKR
jgi:hypothetical protein